MENLRIDPRLQTIIPPLTQDEFNRLEANILEKRESISVEDLCGLIDEAMHTMEFALRIDLVDSHQDVLQRDGAVEAVLTALNRGVKIIHKYTAILLKQREMNIGGDSDG